MGDWRITLIKKRQMVKWTEIEWFNKNDQKTVKDNLEVKP